MVQTSQRRFAFHFLGSTNLTISFLQKPKTTYVALVFIDRHLASVISVKLKTGVQTIKMENRILGKEHSLGYMRHGQHLRKFYEFSQVD